LDHLEQRPRCLLSIDLESWFHARLARGQRCDRESRDPGLAESVDRLLDTLDRAGARATFFVLGSVARTHPELIRRIAVGHEVASHGETHRDLLERARRRGSEPNVHLHPWELPAALPPEVAPLHRLVLSCGSRSLPRKLSDLFRRYRVVPIEDAWRRLAAQPVSPAQNARPSAQRSAVGQA
jgi:hypothetical protein